MGNIIWSDLAIDDVSENIYYLEKEWSEKEVIRFNEKVDEVLEQLSNRNILFKPTEFESVFQIVIVKQITLFYEIKGDDIILLRFWNNYQNPNKLRF
ncbi:type II toxin-antitoxin system RelE/ParE family toxin [Flavobacterium sp.]|uniref:type II toxin-antitoxin system RelE/ParE family toxin n=1 Tax=Flavobacterium sp. TaxID=239 RepID=UPI0040486677